MNDFDFDPRHLNNIGTVDGLRGEVDRQRKLISKLQEEAKEMQRLLDEQVDLELKLKQQIQLLQNDNVVVIGCVVAAPDFTEYYPNVTNPEEALCLACNAHSSNNEDSQKWRVFQVTSFSVYLRELRWVIEKIHQGGKSTISVK